MRINKFILNKLNFTNDEVKEWVRLQNNYSQQFVKNRFQKSIN